eukprot:SAG31_NODE_1728_length_7428_cov_2.495975_1_plen_111_part_10
MKKSEGAARVTASRSTTGGSIAAPSSSAARHQRAGREEGGGLWDVPNVLCQRRPNSPRRARAQPEAPDKVPRLRLRLRLYPDTPAVLNLVRVTQPYVAYGRRAGGGGGGGK